MPDTVILDQLTWTEVESALDEGTDTVVCAVGRVPSTPRPASDRYPALHTGLYMPSCVTNWSIHTTLLFATISWAYGCNSN